MASTHRQAIDHIHRAFRELKNLPTPDPEELADLLGEIRHLETLMADWRRSHLVETIEAKGTAYKTEIRRKAKRSFNVARIIHDAAKAADTTFADGLYELQRLGAIKVTAQWTGLKKAYQVLGLELRVTPHEIEDGDLDAAHVGEVWTESTVSVPVGGK